ncbi:MULTISPECIES: response regulator transcription factor [Persicobacter]|uniref:DNA-binding response regulator n=1 Tax=Persicobacter diffluens TaxID=981 RepID=A0AAN4VYX6_9BACT|nr:response regulator transcription factor [Persicobacter sp. CCB-QB2]GJM61789.1 DNA-binding response regulator [Persicobacter diffluens]
MKLLIVEDNDLLAADMQDHLMENGYLIERAATVADAKEKIGVYSYEVIILDLGLPDGNGLDVIRVLKEKESKTGILIVTANDTVEDKVKGLELGADDYITKPFHQAELNARIKSLIRRKNAQGNNELRVGDLMVNTVAGEVKVGGKTLDLTRKEYELLLYFMYNKNRVLTKEGIAEHLWGDHIDQAENFDFIYNHIKNVRKKITAAGGENSIKSVYGMGYKLTEG